MPQNSTERIASKMKINIGYLYPDLLNLYGDRGNILCLKKRLEDRGIEVEVRELKIGDKFDLEQIDIAFLGGGQEFENGLILDDLKGEKSTQLVEYIENENVLLAISSGFQILGKYSKLLDGSQLDCIGALDFYTVQSNKRMTGNYAFATEDNIKIVGFENHSGKTYLNDNLKSLGNIIKGNGNNGEDGSEGILYKNTFCTYSHGPVLPKNPKFADLLIKKALKKKYNIEEISSLNDEFENKAFDYVMKEYID